MQPFRQTKLNLPKVKVFIKEMVEDYGCTREQAKAQYNRLKKDEIWVNDKYQVNIDRDSWRHQQVTHLSIKRLDKQPIHDWRHLQQIKNELMGPEREALELYPAESRVVDGANQFHLWVIDEGGRIPVGWTEFTGRTEAKGRGVVQRPLDEEGQ